MRLWALAAVVLLVSGCTTLPAPPERPRPSATVDLAQKFVHEHAGFAQFVRGERVAWNATAFDVAQRKNITAHLHVTEENGGGVIHLEGNFPDGIPGVTLADFFGIHGAAFARGAFTFDTLVHNGSAVNDTASEGWAVWVQTKAGAPWVDEADGPGWFLRDGQRVLVTYGALNPDQLKGQQDQVPVPPGATKPPQPA